MPHFLAGSLWTAEYEHWNLEVSEEKTAVSPAGAICLSSQNTRLQIPTQRIKTLSINSCVAFYEEQSGVKSRFGRDTDAEIGRVFSKEAVLGGAFGLDLCRSTNVEQLALFSNYHWLFGSVNFRPSDRL